MPNDETIKAMFADLGRATRRGVRRCPKCGTFNGTRGISCKNSDCDAVFKECAEKKKMSLDACKLITGSATQFYSVRTREKGPDVRGFVMVPSLQTLDADSDGEPQEEALLLSQTSSQCFVDTCIRSYEDKGGHMLAPCMHIQAALRCFTEAEPLSVKNTVVASLNINPEVKQAIWMANDTDGPLVQRVSKNIMVVKCKISPKYPLGYLHVSFFSTKVKDRVEQKFQCSCKSYGTSKPSSGDSYSGGRCLHYYACLCSFASDEKLVQEFSHYLSMESYGESTEPGTVTLIGTLQETAQIVAVVTKQMESGENHVDIRVLGDDTSLLDATGLSVGEDGQYTGSTGVDDFTVQIQACNVHKDGDMVTLSAMDHQLLSGPSDTQTTTIDVPFLSESTKRKKSDSQQAESSAPSSQSTATVALAKRVKKIQANIMSKKETPDEFKAQWSFHQWLASVTERINETMHYQFSGKPDPLVFHVPQPFFDCLRERISYGVKKKRLPNKTEAFVRKDGVPLGSFTKYTWQLNNIIQVKRIFDTPLMQLQITRSFVENRDGTYEHFEHQDDERELFRKTNNAPLIKPLELKTFLKVGIMSPEQKEPTSFQIEWVPDIFPQAQVGEMRIIFEFGHQRTGGILDKKQHPAPPKILYTNIKLHHAEHASNPG